MEDEITPCKRVLLVDRDAGFGVILRNILGKEYALLHVTGVQEGLPHLHSDEIDVVLLNWDQPSRLDHSDCLTILNEAQELEVSPPVLGFSWDERRESAMEAMRLGAWDFFQQPLDILTLKFAMDRAGRPCCGCARTAATITESGRGQSAARVDSNSNDHGTRSMDAGPANRVSRAVSNSLRLL